MNVLMDARHLADQISSIEDINVRVQPRSTYGHIGATLSDAVLQAGLNYRLVVEPRVKRILNKYPFATTTSGLLDAIRQYGANDLLQWRHPEKPRRLVEVAIHLYSSGVERENDLRDWLVFRSNIESLLLIRGIGPKTVDYLKNLVNLQTIAVDRHIRTFVVEHGLQYSEYHEIQRLVGYTADLLNVTRSSLDHAIWLYMSNRSHI